MLTLGQRLKITRIIANKKQKDLELETGISRVNIAKYENDKVIPKFNTIEKIEKSIGKLVPKDFSDKQ
ncbi:helix-turn-helix domain-containing protein [Streptobacillus moniliformis]|uniref:helix-turn-helix domain-containing protein n=1 Tax=Streptobacillus moniliformis TaxID=34105 RepID=UPI0007E44CAC|nr:helix-turn-helix transcriptional regulator [Streptobacillus moniliformis]